jgi:elongation factor P
VITTAEFRNGISIVLDGQVYTIVEFQHVKPGKGRTFVRTRLRKLATGQVIEKTFTAGESIEDAFVERRPTQYVYRSGVEWTFMDLDTFEQFDLGEDMVAESEEWLIEGMEVSVTYHNGTPMGMEVPQHLELKVIEAEPGLRGDTAQGGNKPIKVDPGVTIQAPLFIEVGDTVKVDTRTKSYIERVRK